MGGTQAPAKTIGSVDDSIRSSDIILPFKRKLTELTLFEGFTKGLPLIEGFPMGFPLIEGFRMGFPLIEGFIWVSQ